MGKLEHITLTLGALKVWLQAHVVINAPFRVLLGRPFFAHCASDTKDEVDGSQYITLTDPNSGRQFGLATRERTDHGHLQDNANYHPDF